MSVIAVVLSILIVLREFTTSKLFRVVVLTAMYNTPLAHTAKSRESII